MMAPGTTHREGIGTLLRAHHCEMAARAAAWREFVTIFAIATALKLLLFPAYHSTDFEVHRNWLAVAHTLPPSQWYHEATSRWTLDYPPLFAWFERALACVAHRVCVPLGLGCDPRMLAISAAPYASAATVAFQRGSVVAADAALLWGAWGAARAWPRARARAFAVLVLLSPGLLAVDHVHFQYNGLLLGLLLRAGAELSAARAGRAGRAARLRGAALFAALLCAKHLFACVAPLVALWLLRAHCFEGGPPPGRFRARGLAELASVVLLVLALSFGPCYA